MAIIGELPRLWIGADWESFVERLEQVFELNNISEEKKKSMLITCMDHEVYDKLRDLCHPEKPKSKTYAELCTLMKDQNEKNISMFQERFIFYSSKQKDDESVQEWYIRIKNLWHKCKFNLYNETVLLIRFITGLKSLPILERMSEEDLGQLTLEHALSIALAKE